MPHSFQSRAAILFFLVLAIALLIFAFARPTAGQGPQRSPPSAANGQRIAEMMCTNCHLVTPGQQSTAVVGVPSFAAIANHAGQTPERLAGAIIIPHPPMPSVSLTNAEMRDIIAYIFSLRTEK